MSTSKPVKCSVCNRPIKTTFGAAQLNRAPVVCRRCFGDQSYNSSSHWSYNVLVSENTPPGA